MKKYRITGKIHKDSSVNVKGNKNAVKQINGNDVYLIDGHNFSNFPSLEKLDNVRLKGSINLKGCTKLTSLNVKDLHTDLDISDSIITSSSLDYIAENAQTVDNKTIILNQPTYDGLSDTTASIFETKGFNFKVVPYYPNFIKLMPNSECTFYCSSIDNEDEITFTYTNNLDTVSDEIPTPDLSNYEIIRIKDQDSRKSLVEFSGNLSSFKYCTKWLTVTSQDPESPYSNNAAFTNSGESLFNRCSNLEVVRVKWRPLNLIYMFENDSKLRELPLDGWDLSGCESMYRMLYISSNTPNTSLSKLNFENIIAPPKNLKYMFTCYYTDGLTELTGISDWNMSEVTMFPYLVFSGNENKNITICDLSNWDMSNKTYLRSFVYNQRTDIGDISKWKITNACTTLAWMLYHTNLTGSYDLTGWDVSGSTTFRSMFANVPLSYIDISGWDMSNAVYSGANDGTGVDFCFGLISEADFPGEFRIKMDNVKLPDGYWVEKTEDSVDQYSGHFSGLEMFEGNERIHEIDMSTVTVGNSLYTMFQNCLNLETFIPPMDMSNVEDVSWMFYGTRLLKNVDFSTWKLPKCKYFRSFFHGYNGDEKAPFPKDFDLLTKSIDVTNLIGINAPLAENIDSFFTNRAGLTEIIGINTWDTSRVKSIATLFEDCVSLEVLDISNWSLEGCTQDTVCEDARNRKRGRAFDLIGDCEGHMKLHTLVLGNKFFTSPVVDRYIFDYISEWSRESILESLYTNQEGRDYSHICEVVLHYDAYTRLTEEDLELILSRGLKVSALEATYPIDILRRLYLSRPNTRNITAIKAGTGNGEVTFSPGLSGLLPLGFSVKAGEKPFRLYYEDFVDFTLEFSDNITVVSATNGNVTLKIDGGFDMDGVTYYYMRITPWVFYASWGYFKYKDEDGTVYTVYTSSGAEITVCPQSTTTTTYKKIDDHTFYIKNKDFFKISSSTNYNIKKNGELVRLTTDQMLNIYCNTDLGCSLGTIRSISTNNSTWKSGNNSGVKLRDFEGTMTLRAVDKDYYPWDNTKDKVLYNIGDYGILRYIYLNGTQWVHLNDINTTGTSSIESKFRSLKDKKTGFIWCDRTSASSPNLGNSFLLLSTNKYRVDYGSSTQYGTTNIYLAHVAKCESGKYWLDDVLIKEYTPNSSLKVSGKGLFIGMSQLSGTASSISANGFNGIIYYVKVDGKTFLPAVNKDDVSGLYCEETGKFYEILG